MSQQDLTFADDLIAKDAAQLAVDEALLLKAALQERLKLTVDQRILAHENARELARALRQSGEALRGKPKDPVGKTDR